MISRRGENWTFCDGDSEVSFRFGAGSLDRMLWAPAGGAMSGKCLSRGTTSGPWADSRGGQMIRTE